MISQELIESALQLTDKTMIDMNILPVLCKFSIQNFYYYLLSKPFLSEYEPYYWVQFKDSMRYRVWHAFQEAITAYQDGNDKLLVDLLGKLV